MGNLLSHKKNPRATITDADRAVLSLKAQRKKLEDQSKLLEKRVEQNVVVARELITAKKRDRALIALKKKKMNENQLQTIHAWLLNVEDMLSNMEVTKQQSAVLAALKSGNEALKQAQAEMSIDDVQKLMDETAEAKEYMDKVQDVLSGELDESDTEAVMTELAALEEATLKEEMDQIPVAPKVPAAAAAEDEELPSVPSSQVVATGAAEEPVEEERQLEAPLAAS